MRKTVLVLLLALSSHSSQAQGWFQQKTTLTNAHQYLLEDNISESYSALIQVWQQEANDHLSPHLNDLFIQLLEKDCGKSITKSSFPNWLDSVSITQQSLERPGRISYSISIQADSNHELTDISLEQWPNVSVAIDETLSGENADDNNYTYQKYYDLSKRLSEGLYQLTITNKSGVSWSSWIMLTDEMSDHKVRWSSKDTWVVEKTKLLNPHCPLPVQHVSVFDYIDDEYKKVWDKKYETNYPNQLQVRSLPTERYVLTVSMSHSRWQGHVLYQDQQIISKTLDLTEE
jgi:hypothetical protein